MEPQQQIAEHLRQLKINDVVAVTNQQASNVVDYGFVKAFTPLGFIIADVKKQGDHFFDYQGNSHTEKLAIRPATEEESLVHRIRQTSGKTWLATGKENLRKVASLLERTATKKKPQP